MPKYVIEREIPGAGKLTSEQLKGISQTSCGVLSTVEDLTKYCQDLIKCSKGEGVLLKKDSFYKMTEAQFKDHDFPDAICWDLSFSPLIGHAGNDFGSSTLMYFNPENGIGQILFSNNSIGNEKLDEDFYEIFNLLFKYDLKK
jgi:hypothetical protein